MSTILEALRALVKARKTYPATLRGQQEHFAKTLPEAEERLEQALLAELSEDERQTLANVLSDLVPEEDEIEAAFYDFDTDSFGPRG